MNTWSLASEYFALILLMVIALFIHDSKAIHGFQRRRFYYLATLMLSALSILLDIAATNVLGNLQSHSVVFALVLNSLYFFTSWAMVTFMVYYLFLRVLEFTYDSVALLRARILLIVILVIFSLLLVVNAFTGIVFYIDPSGAYCRGPLNYCGHLLAIIDLVLLIASYIHHRNSVGKATEKVLFVAAPISVILLVYQLLYPDQLLNGALSSIVSLIIFISYHGDRQDQDFLTSLDSRHAFSAEITEHTDTRQCYQIILIKLRHLSRLNNIYGQNGCNTILFQLGDAMRKFASVDGAAAYRYSEERFALTFDDADPANCDMRLSQVTERLKQRWKLGKYEVSLAFHAIDFRYSGQDWAMEDINTYLENAVHAAITEDMEVFPFTEELFYKHQLREYILRSMHTALRDNRFKIYYQPIYYSNSGKFESVEALMRMTDESGKPISPNDFIPIAEETGFLDDLLEFLLENVCRLLSSGKIKDLKAVSINLPIREFARSDLKERLRNIVEKYNVNPKQIKIEITERDVDEGRGEALDAINSLIERGYSFMLDDFGVAYSNLSRLLSIPFESIKLDRSLVLLLDKHSTDHNILKEYIIPLLLQLGHNIVAEGVETKELADYLLGCGVNCIQGYYYAKPMPKDELLSWYSEH